MKKETLGSYTSDKYLKALIPGPAKVGKTCNLATQALGLFPGQKSGGLVTHPSHLHIMTFDTAAAEGLLGFMTKSCGIDRAVASEVEILNFEDDVRRVTEETSSHNPLLLNSVLDAMGDVHGRIKKDEVHVVIVSSLTGIADALLRAVSGFELTRQDGTPQKSVMDMNKWSMYGEWMRELRNFLQRDRLHLIWEAHIITTDVPDPNNKGKTIEKGSLPLVGKTGENFPYNVAQVMGLQRKFGVFPDPKKAPTVEKIIYNTRPNLTFVSNGRGFNEQLDREESCIVEVAKKLGKVVGGWKP